MIHPGQRISVPGAPAPRTPTSTTRPAPTSENTFAGYTYSDATVRAARKNREALAKVQVPSRTEVAAMIRRTALRHGVHPTLALAVGWQESGWNQRAVSVANAIGAMQVIPSSGDWASQLAGRRLDLLDAQDNVTAGVVILRAPSPAPTPSRRPSPATTRACGRSGPRGCSRTPRNMSPRCRHT